MRSINAPQADIVSYLIALFLSVMLLISHAPHSLGQPGDETAESETGEKKEAEGESPNILDELASREWYKERKDDKSHKTEAATTHNDADISSLKKSASEEMESIVVLLSEIPTNHQKALYAPIFLTEKKNIFNSNTDLSFKWVGFKVTTGLKQNKFPWKKTSLSETVIGSFLYASGTNFGFAGGKFLEEKRFYTNYASEIVTFKWNMPYRFATAYTLDSRQYFFVKREPPENFVMPANHVNIFPRIDLNYERLREKGVDQLTEGFGVDTWAGYGVRSRWRDWGEPGNMEDADYARRFLIYCFTMTSGLLFGDNQNVLLRARYKGGMDNDFLNRPRFGGTIDNAKLDVIHGFTVDQFRVNSFALVNFKYSFNIVQRLRMNLFADYAHIFPPDREDIWGSGYGVRILAWGGLPIWITHGIGQRVYPKSRAVEQTIMVMTAAGW